MMHKLILDDRKKEFRGLTIHKNGAISSSKVCVKSTHMSSSNECLETRRHQNFHLIKKIKIKNKNLSRMCL